LIGGHVLATAIGILVDKLAGPTLGLRRVAVGIAISAIHWTRSFHPPAGIDPLIVVHNMS
jgi:CBS-domain-containing membrane protein